MKLLFVQRALQKETLALAENKISALSEKLSCEVALCVFGKPEEVSVLAYEEARMDVFALSSKTCLVENIADSLVALAKEKEFTGVVVADGQRAAELAYAMADRMSAKCVTAITDLEKWDDDSGKTDFFCRKKVYNNIVQAEYRLEEPFVVSERMAFDKAPVKEGKGTRIDLPACKEPACVKAQQILSSREEKKVSPILIAAGMGITSKEEIDNIRDYAKENGFSFGVSRPVAMRGWAGIDEIIGVSGTIYAPEVAILLGVSGSAAFRAGVEQSGFILAVNNNSEANITKHADAIIVDDYQNVMPALFETLKEWKQEY